MKEEGKKMLSREKYRELCKTEQTIPIFSKDWWLDTICGENNLIPEGAVFVPGHSGDLLGGSHTPNKLNPSKADYNLDDTSK